MEEKKVYHVTFDMTDSSNNMNFYEKTKLNCRKVTEHFAVRSIIIVLIVIDIFILIAVFNTNNSYITSNLKFVAFGFSIVFMVEILMRIYGFGLKTFFKNWINITDFCVTVVTFLTNLISIILEIHLENPKKPSLYTEFLVILRMLRVLRILNLIRIYINKDNFVNSSRYLTSENKRRYRLDGYDLDLCFITDRIIAMSFPSSGISALYRNSISDVASFFNSRYGRSYKIYNLCEEKEYNTVIFNGQVERFMISDHNVPRLQEMIQFAQSSRKWLLENEENVIAVHCRGGKGRTGTMICVHLIDSEVFDNAELCLRYFGHRRTDLLQGHKFQGVETPSQSRYVGYFEVLKKHMNYCIPEMEKLRLDKIVIHGCERLCNRNKSNLSMEVIQGNLGIQRETTLFYINLDESDKCQIEWEEINSRKVLNILIYDSPNLQQDIKIKFFSSQRNVPNGYDNCSFFFWFHTFFIEKNILSLQREQLDNLHRKNTWNIYDADFKVDVFFKTIDHK